MRFTLDRKAGAFEWAVKAWVMPVARATTTAMGAAAQALKREARAEIGRAGFSRRWQNALRVQRFPRHSLSIDAAAFAWHRIPYAGAFETGASTHPAILGQERMKLETSPGWSGARYQTELLRELSRLNLCTAQGDWGRAIGSKAVVTHATAIVRIAITPIAHALLVPVLIASGVPRSGSMMEMELDTWAPVPAPMPTSARVSAPPRPSTAPVPPATPASSPTPAMSYLVQQVVLRGISAVHQLSGVRFLWAQQRWPNDCASGRERQSAQHVAA